MPLHSPISTQIPVVRNRAAKVFRSDVILMNSESEISVPAVEFTAVLIKKYSVSGSPVHV